MLLAALEEMDKDGLTTVDCTNVLRGGVLELPEVETPVAL